MPTTVLSLIELLNFDLQALPLKLEALPLMINVTTIERIDLSVGSLLSVIKCEYAILFKSLTKLPMSTKAGALYTKIKMNMVVDTNIEIR